MFLYRETIYFAGGNCKVGCQNKNGKRRDELEVNNAVLWVTMRPIKDSYK